MPTYEYECDSCDHRFEAFQSITAAPLQKCPECGRKQVRRLISGGAGFLFKGSGFYTTDYRNEGYKQAAKKDKESSTSKDKSETKKSDAKKSNGKGKDKKKEAA